MTTELVAIRVNGETFTIQCNMTSSVPSWNGTIQWYYPTPPSKVNRT